MRLDNGTLVGQRMLAAWEYVQANPGCHILPVAHSIGPNGSLRFGYRAVHRAIQAGMLTATQDTHGHYELHANPVRVHPNVPRVPFAGYVQRRY